MKDRRTLPNKNKLRLCHGTYKLFDGVELILILCVSQGVAETEHQAPQGGAEGGGGEGRGKRRVKCPSPNP